MGSWLLLPHLCKFSCWEVSLEPQAQGRYAYRCSRHQAHLGSVLLAQKTDSWNFKPVSAFLKSPARERLKTNVEGRFVFFGSQTETFISSASRGTSKESVFHIKEKLGRGNVFPHLAYRNEWEHQFAHNWASKGTPEIWCSSFIGRFARSAETSTCSCTTKFLRCFSCSLPGGKAVQPLSALTPPNSHLGPRMTKTGRLRTDLNFISAYFWGQST